MNAMTDALKTAHETLRQRRADGGPLANPAPIEAYPDVKMHSGPIHSPVAGRTDHLPIHVASGSYVIPADVISGMGEGNTMSGFKVAKSIFSRPLYSDGSGGKSAPYAATAMPYGQDAPSKASGGSVKGVPIVAAGGEYVIHPDDVAHIGSGSLDDGHKILDHFVKKMRSKIIKTMSDLPGPAKD